MWRFCGPPNPSRVRLTISDVCLWQAPRPRQRQSASRTRLNAVADRHAEQGAFTVSSRAILEPNDALALRARMLELRRGEADRSQRVFDDPAGRRARRRGVRDNGQRLFRIHVAHTKKGGCSPPSRARCASDLLATMPAAVVATEKAAGRADEPVPRRVAVVGGVAVDLVPAIAGMGVRIVIAVGVAVAIDAIAVMAVVMGVGIARAERRCGDAARSADGSRRHIARPGEGIVVPLMPAVVQVVVPAVAIAVIAIGQTALIIAGIGISRSLVLAIGVWIELRAITGIVDHLLGHRRAYSGACQRGRDNRGGTQDLNFGHACLHWSAHNPTLDVGGCFPNLTGADFKPR